ncbi:UNVERIFIED_CONTAM: hypothetical protein HDU68_001908 [Siphonaria sp. JEL0065]|nr:hypothetical protein HDU68_001908 [Siphonaria sp. JEL0065]
MAHIPHQNGGLSRKAQVTASTVTGALTNFTIQIFSDSACKNPVNSVTFVANDVVCQSTNFYNSRISYAVFNVFNGNAISTGGTGTGTDTGSGSGGGSGAGSSSDFTHSPAFYGAIAGAVVLVVLAVVFWTRKRKNQPAPSTSQVNYAPPPPSQNNYGNATQAIYVPGPASNYSTPVSHVSTPIIVASQKGAQTERLGVYGTDQRPPTYSITADGSV